LLFGRQTQAISKPALSVASALGAFHPAQLVAALADTRVSIRARSQDKAGRSSAKPPVHTYRGFHGWARMKPEPAIHEKRRLSLAFGIWRLGFLPWDLELGTWCLEWSRIEPPPRGAPVGDNPLATDNADFADSSSGSHPCDPWNPGKMGSPLCGSATLRENCPCDGGPFSHAKAPRRKGPGNRPAFVAASASEWSWDRPASAASAASCRTV